ncbi:MAG: hypothetical protein PHY09_00575 [Desulfuromonadaceae bacterium]|nr:hypothetical protein [Desulfuromonadaceae bacterium]MDD5106503.1 hypothetical protein [Desulfuromonadaceae bacterium]
MSALLRLSRQLVLLTAILIVTGCAATSTFTPYPYKVEPLVSSMAHRSPLDLSKTLASERTGSDLILYNMEHGRYAQVIGAGDASMSDFSASMEKIRTNDEKALISATALGATVAATMVNDNAIPYEGEGYERVLLHHYQALNYLKKNDLEGAGVEVRRANAEQEEALSRFENELEQSREEASEKRVSSNSIARVNSQYAQMDEVAGKVKNSFQNAYTFYVSAVIYELLQQPNDAYIDYKKALEIYPENSYLLNDVLRLAAQLDMRDDLAELQQRFPMHDRQVTTGSGSGKLLVLFEDGFAPQKYEVKLPIPIGKAGLVSIAFPLYKERWSEPTPLRIFNNTAFVGSTETICDIRALAVKALTEKAPMIATRQIIRAVSKGVTSAQAKKNLGDLGQFAAIVWNLVSENADLRSWLTLPANAQIMKVSLPAGHHLLTLQHPLGTPTSVEVDITGGGTAVLHVVRAGRQIYSSVTTFH